MAQPYHHIETNPHFIDPEEITPEQRQFLPHPLLSRHGHTQRMPSRGRRDQHPRPTQSQEERIPSSGRRDQRRQPIQSQEEHIRSRGPQDQQTRPRRTLDVRPYPFGPSPQDQQPQLRQTLDVRPLPLGSSLPGPLHEGQPHEPHVSVPPVHHDDQRPHLQPQPLHEGQPHVSHVSVPPVHHDDQRPHLHPQPRQGPQRLPLEMWVPSASSTQGPKPKKEKRRSRHGVVMDPQLQDQHPRASLIKPQPEVLGHHPSPGTATPQHHDHQPQEQRPHSRLFLPQDRRTKAHTWCAAAFCIIFWLIVIIGGLIVLIVYLLFRPRSPHFDVNSVTLNAAYLDMGYLLNADLTVLANFTNPNKKVSVDFSYMYLDLYFYNTLIATQYIPPFSAARGQSRFASIHMVSSQVRLSMKESLLLQKQINNNRVIFTVKGVFRARSNLGSFLKYSYWLHGQCVILLSSPPTGVLRDKRCKTKH